MIKIICNLAVLGSLLSYNVQAARLSASEFQAEKERLDAECEMGREELISVGKFSD